MQFLEGVGAGIFGAMTPLVVADLMRGTGRSDASRGALATVQGIGASLSDPVAGLIVVMLAIAPPSWLSLASRSRVYRLPPRHARDRSPREERSERGRAVR